MNDKLVQLKLTIRPRWWFRPALFVSSIALKYGLIGDAESAEHLDGRITAEERVAHWLTKYAFRYGDFGR